MSHSLINSFNYQIAMAKGGGSGEMGNAMTISAVSELPTMFLFGYLLKKKSSVFWFRLSGLFFVLKSIGTFLAFNIPTYYAVQPFQMFGWALINVACVYYVDGIMEPQDSIKGQAYMAMTITAGNVMSSLFGGWLIDAAGVGAMLICASLCGLHRLADCVPRFERSKNCIGKIKKAPETERGSGRFAVQLLFISVSCILLITVFLQR